jgi:hypothetical protein
MKKPLLVLTLLAFLSHADAQSSAHIPLSNGSMHKFQTAGMDIKAYQWNEPSINLHLHAAQRDFKISNGLLAGGLASGVVGSTAIVVGALNVRLSQSIDRIHVPLICTGLGLNLVALPVFFIMRDVVDKRAARNIQIAQRMLNP